MTNGRQGGAHDAVLTLHGNADLRVRPGDGALHFRLLVRLPIAVARPGPKARGAAARLHEEALGYAQRVVAQAEGDAQRFRAVLAEYQKAAALEPANPTFRRNVERVEAAIREAAQP